LLGVSDASLGGLGEGVLEELTPLAQGVLLTGGEDLAGRGGQGEGVHLGDEGDGGLDGLALLGGPILERPCRHGGSPDSLGDSGSHPTFPFAYFQRHTMRAGPSGVGFDSRK
jgi:hypothetical protein